MRAPIVYGRETREKICQMVSKIGKLWGIKMAPPAIVMIGEGIGTMICSTRPPINIAREPLLLIRARIDSRIFSMGLVYRGKNKGKRVKRKRKKNDK